MKLGQIIRLFLLFYFVNPFPSTASQINTSHTSNLVGKFKNDQEYLNALKVLIQSTDETKNRINFIKEEILPRINKDKVLDVGIGNGELTRILCEHFNTLHLVDPSHNALESIKQSYFPNKIIKKYRIEIERYVFPKDYYDLIINAHTLSHVSRDHWKSIIEKSYAALKKGGVQLIVINNGLGRSKLTNAFGNKNDIKIEKLLEDCVTLKNSLVIVIPTYEKFKTPSLEEILEISGVCLQDIHLAVPKNILVDFLNKNFKQDNNYVIDFCQYYILIKKH